MRIARAETGWPAWSYTHTLPRQPVLCTRLHTPGQHARTERARVRRVAVPARDGPLCRRVVRPFRALQASERKKYSQLLTTESKHRELADACTTPSSGSSCAPTTHACGARSGQHATVPQAHPPADSRNRRRQPACHAAAMQRAKIVQPCRCTSHVARGEAGKQEAGGRARRHRIREES